MIGSDIRNLRKAYNITLEHLGKEIGYSGGYLSTIENNYSKINTRLEKLIKHFFEKEIKLYIKKHKRIIAKEEQTNKILEKLLDDYEKLKDSIK